MRSYPSKMAANQKSSGERLPYAYMLAVAATAANIPSAKVPLLGCICSPCQPQPLGMSRCLGMCSVACRPRVCHDLSATLLPLLCRFDRVITSDRAVHRAYSQSLMCVPLLPLPLPSVVLDLLRGFQFSAGWTIAQFSAVSAQFCLWAATCLSSSPHYSADACAAPLPLGWQLAAHISTCLLRPVPMLVPPPPPPPPTHPPTHHHHHHPLPRPCSVPDSLCFRSKDRRLRTWKTRPQEGGDFVVDAVVRGGGLASSSPFGRSSPLRPWPPAGRRPFLLVLCPAAG